ncbi:MAG: ATP-binding cassette domain-containing protein [Ignavibacteriaceae bacterium]|nr:ATP-binding cassette domain-containing protein [Ignavibacteriaceae bacterium]
MEKTLIDLHLIKNIHTIEGKRKLNISLQIPEYGFITLFGKSGVGKTTMLRMISGLTKPDSGYIKVDNEIWFSNNDKVNIKTQERNIGFVFQDYALFPNMTVEEHLYYAQKERNVKHVNELLEIFSLEGLKKRKPDTLSGGQKQRTAVARALARKPQILLLDEPLSALDAETRQILQQEIMAAHKSFLATTILVSHDVDEISRLTDRVFVIDNGVIIKSGPPELIFGSTEADKNLSVKGKVISTTGNELKIRLNEGEINKLRAEDPIKIISEINSKES